MENMAVAAVAAHGLELMRHPGTVGEAATASLL